MTTFLAYLKEIEMNTKKPTSEVAERIVRAIQYAPRETNLYGFMEKLIVEALDAERETAFDHWYANASNAEKELSAERNLPHELDKQTVSEVKPHHIRQMKEALGRASGFLLGKTGDSILSVGEECQRVLTNLYLSGPEPVSQKREKCDISTVEWPDENAITDAACKEYYAAVREKGESDESGMVRIVLARLAFQRGAEWLKATMTEENSK